MHAAKVSKNQKKQQKVAKKATPKKVKKVAKQQTRSMMTAPRAQRQAVAQQRTSFTAPVAAPQQASFIAKPDFSLNPAASLFALKKRQMSTMTGVNMRVLVPTDPRFADDDVISVLNTKTGLIEPVIVAAPDFSFEWIYGSPCDLHTFDVIPVVKDCIDPADPLVESMGA